MKLIIAFLLYFSVCSCISPKKGMNFPTEIRHCVENRLNEKTEKLNLSTSDVDFYKEIKKFEEVLLERKLLNNKKQESYEDLLEKIKSGEDFSKEFVNIKNHLPTFTFLNTDITIYMNLYSNCPSIILDEKKDNTLYKLKLSYDEIIRTGYPTIENIENIAKLTDFNNEDSRLPLTNLIYLNLYRQYEDIPSYQQKELEENEGLFYEKKNN